MKGVTPPSPPPPSPAEHPDLALVRAATDKYHSIAIAKADGYTFEGPNGCIESHGLHYYNPALTASAELQVEKPEVLLTSRQRRDSSSSASNTLGTPARVPHPRCSTMCSTARWKGTTQVSRAITTFTSGSGGRTFVGCSSPITKTSAADRRRPPRDPAHFMERVRLVQKKCARLPVRRAATLLRSTRSAPMRFSPGYRARTSSSSLRHKGRRRP